MNEFEVAAYIDRRLPGAARSRVEGHLADCSECRDEVVHAQLLLWRLRQPRRLLMGAGLVAAAAVMILLVWPGIRRSDTTVRDGGNGVTLVAYGPIGETARTALRFVWATAPRATTYRLTVSGADGSLVWSGSVADTVATLPDSALLRSDRSYYWVADALLEDGTTRSTGLRQFHLLQ